MFENILSRLGGGSFDIVEFLTRIFVIIFSLSVHEFAHAYWARRLGDDTAERAGRLTLNPLAHLDPLGTLMMVFARVGWAKPVPINPVQFTRAKTMKRGILEVSLAGPVSNLILSFISYFIRTLLIFAFPSVFLGKYYIVISILETLFILNIFLAVFNLLPVPPLDGFKIFGTLLPDRLYYKLMSYERYIGLVFIALVIFGGGIFGLVINALASPIITAISYPINLLFGFLDGLIA